MLIKEENSEINYALQGINADNKEKVRQFIENYKPQSPPEEVAIEMDIIVKDETTISRHLRKLSPKESEEVTQ